MLYENFLISGEKMHLKMQRFKLKPGKIILHRGDLMLKNTFLHIPGVGKNTENKIWKSGIHSWDQYLEKHNKVNLKSSKKELINHYVNQSITAYDDRKYSFFVDNMQGNLHWRAYPDLKKRCCFLDIETTGLDKHHDEITVIGLYDGRKSRFFVNGDNLQDFSDEIKKHDMIISFNGRCFDIPFIASKFPDIPLNKFHVDLRFAMRAIGYYGGLKRIEKMVGIKRDDDLEEVDGFEAVRLWHKFKRGDESALDLLIKYNQADIENLNILMDFAFDRLRDQDFKSVVDII